MAEVAWKSELIIEEKLVVRCLAYILEISQCGKIFGKVYYECVYNKCTFLCLH